MENISQWSFTEVGDAAQNTSSGIREVSDERGEMQLTDPSTAQELTADGPRGLAGRGIHWCNISMSSGRLRF